MGEFFVKTLAVGSYAANCYIIGDKETRECAVIDPGAEFSKINQWLEQKELKVKYIFLTHGHFDHIGAAMELKRATGAPLLVNSGDDYLYSDTLEPDGDLLEGEKYEVAGQTLEVIATPGHTIGGICLYIRAKKILFAGDTLFYRSVGRTDLEGGNFKQLINGIVTKLMVLDDDVLVYPGHGLKTTIGDERRHNMFIQS